MLGWMLMHGDLRTIYRDEKLIFRYAYVSIAILPRNVEKGSAILLVNYLYHQYFAFTHACIYIYIYIC